ncbi:hypothetical protein HanPI659440_Chr07g0275101 [Helianthus annuus]|nr:hypothetical protein HanPI659440_Chr07g0275101 [Helianthus annuus]
MILGLHLDLDLKSISKCKRFVFSVEDIFKIHRFANSSKVKKMCIQVIVVTVCLCIWKARNNKVFILFIKDFVHFYLFYYPNKYNKKPYSHPF